MISKKAFLITAVAASLMASPALARPTTSSSSLIAGLSGHSGDRTSRQQELARGKGVIKISIEKSGDTPCALSIAGKRVGQNADFESEESERCSGSTSASSSVSASYGSYVTAVKACTGSRHPRAIQSFEIETVEIDRRGNMDQRSSRSSSSSKCDRWHHWSRCPSGAVMTGFIAHFNDIKSGPDALVGLQAVCRQVISK